MCCPLLLTSLFQKVMLHNGTDKNSRGKPDDVPDVDQHDARISGNDSERKQHGANERQPERDCPNQCQPKVGGQKQRMRSKLGGHHFFCILQRKRLFDAQRPGGCHSEDGVHEQLGKIKQVKRREQEGNPETAKEVKHLDRNDRRYFAKLLFLKQVDQQREHKPDGEAERRRLHLKGDEERNQVNKNPEQGHEHGTTLLINVG